jgi:HAD superfamily hydrolase (TIGR01509 family)
VEERQRIAAEKEAEYRDIYKDEIEPLAGLMNFLEEARELSIPLAIATAGPPENCFFALDALGIRDRFTHIVHSAMVSKGKPNPEAFQQAAAGMDLQLSDCLVFEDSLTGAEAAKNANSPAVVITTTHARAEFGHFEHILTFQRDFGQLGVAPLADGFGLLLKG